MNLREFGSEKFEWATARSRIYDVTNLIVTDEILQLANHAAAWWVDLFNQLKAAHAARCDRGDLGSGPRRDENETVSRSSSDKGRGAPRRGQIGAVLKQVQLAFGPSRPKAWSHVPAGMQGLLVADP